MTIQTLAMAIGLALLSAAPAPVSAQQGSAKASQAYPTLLESETVRWGKVVKAAGIKSE